MWLKNYLQNNNRKENMTWGEKFTAHVLRSLPTLFNLLAVFSEIFFTCHFLINYFTVFHILILKVLKC